MTEPDEVCLDDQQAGAAQYLVTHPDQVSRASGREPVREALLWLTRGRRPRRHGWPVVPRLGTPWQDTVSNERIGWRMRAANLRGFDAGDAAVRDEYVFEVDYQLCQRCRIGWVEQPHTLDPYRRRGLAAGGLAALRTENPGFTWPTLGGHIDGSPSFWDTIGADVPGGYRQRDVCEHITPGG